MDTSDEQLYVWEPCSECGQKLTLGCLPVWEPIGRRLFEEKFQSLRNGQLDVAIFNAGGLKATLGMQRLFSMYTQTTYRTVCFQLLEYRSTENSAAGLFFGLV